MANHIFTRRDVMEILNLQPRAGPGTHPEIWIASGRTATKARYEIIIFWSDEDEAFVAEAPELPGCMADERARQESLASAETAIEEWIEAAREIGRPIPRPKGRLAYA